MQGIAAMENKLFFHGREPPSIFRDYLGSEFNMWIMSLTWVIVAMEKNKLPRLSVYVLVLVNVMLK